MYKNGNSIIYSPTDLTTFVSSPFANWMNRFALEEKNVIALKDSTNGMMEKLAECGILHEKKQLEKFRSAGKIIHEVPSKGSSRERLQATIAAMKSGVDVIYQAYLELLPFAGVADFLVKVPATSSLGDWQYEIWDTKLSSDVKPAYLLQMSCYAEMLQSIQHNLPGTLTVALGSGHNQSFKTQDYFYYYLCIKAEFLKSQENFDPNRPIDPDGSDSYGNWTDYANQLFIQKDHLIQVANIRKSQILKLQYAGVATMTQLANLPNEFRVTGINTETLSKLRSQAKIQLDSAGLAKPLFKIIQNENQGLATLPTASRMDIFFDIEGFPLEKGGLEYLWGSTYFDEKNQRQFIDFWAHNEEQEKQCFIEFIQWAYDRWQRDPRMHIYHYASYEITACRKLMGKYGVCEMEVDQLLRNEVFVDLYKIVKAGLLLGEPRYSIKNVEHLYRAKRNTDVANGGDSVVVYDNWRSQFVMDHPNQQPNRLAWKEDKNLSDIRDYNKDDCDSTQELVDWLREQQELNQIPRIVLLPESDKPDAVVETSPLYSALISIAERDRLMNPNKIPIAETIAGLLGFHRRESKPMFWRLFDRRDADVLELFEDLDCIAGCTRTNKPAFKVKERDRNQAYEYSFDPNQECKGLTGDYYIHESLIPESKSKKVEVIEIDTSAGLLIIKAAKEPPSNVSLIPDEHVQPEPIPSAISAVALRYMESDGNVDSAIFHFLRREPPNISGITKGQAIIYGNSSSERLQSTIKAITSMEGTCLTIQGPPGTGKTYTASHVIAELVKNRKKVGISSNSHKAINNLLIRTAELCQQKNIQGSFVCTKNTDNKLSDLGVTIKQNSSLIESLQNGQVGCVIGTTAWGFCRAELEDQFDYLFVDEAGQVSVANLVGMSNSSKNIVLIGDQMQLGQPTQGTHPGESGLSTLDYFMGDQATIADTKGIFLNTTSRMHPTINHFISNAIYDGRLLAAPNNEKQIIKVPKKYTGILNQENGITVVPVIHTGNSQASDEEVDVIGNLCTELLTRSLVDKHGEERNVTWDDMLFVAPYNFQVNKLRTHLSRIAGGENAQVGTVDRFQGQEAAIVLVSMCSSDPNESPRGLDFLFDEHRLNVAISRARSLAVVVMNPNLVTTNVSNPNQMRKVNLLSRLFLGK